MVESFAGQVRLFVQNAIDIKRFPLQHVMTQQVYILGASGSSTWSGSDGLWIHAAKRLTKEYQVCTISPLSQETLAQHGLEPHRHVQLPALASKTFVSRLALKILGIGLLKRIRPRPQDVVLFSQGSIDTFLDKLYSNWLKRLTCNVVSLTQLNTENQVYTAKHVEAGREFFSRAYANVFVSQRNLDVAKRQFLFHFDNGHVIHNAPKFNMNELAWPSDEPIQLACVGRFEAQTKGQLVLLEALSKLTHKSWRLNFYGSGPDEKLIQKAIQHYGLADHCKIRGYVNHPKEIWNINHALALFSTMEGFPLVVAEAMLSGRVCVLSDVGGNIELLEGGQLDLVAPAANPKHAVAALTKLFAMTHNDLWGMGKRNARIARNHRLDQTMVDLCEIIESAMAHA